MRRARGPRPAWVRAAAAMIALAAAWGTAGCQKREPSFDQRYENAQKVVASQAAAIDADLAERERERLAAEAALGDPASGATPPVTPATPPASGAAPSAAAPTAVSGKSADTAPR